MLLCTCLRPWVLKLGACWRDPTPLVLGSGLGVVPMQWQPCKMGRWIQLEPSPCVSWVVLLEGSSRGSRADSFNSTGGWSPCLIFARIQHRPCGAAKAVSFQTSATALNSSGQTGSFLMRLLWPASMRRCRVDPQWGWPERQIRRASRRASTSATPRCRCRLRASTARLQTPASRRQDETRIPEPPDVFLQLLQ
jgi:hypothetical protein